MSSRCCFTCTTAADRKTPVGVVTFRPAMSRDRTPDVRHREPSSCVMSLSHASRESGWVMGMEVNQCGSHPSCQTPKSPPPCLSLRWDTCKRCPWCQTRSMKWKLWVWNLCCLVRDKLTGWGVKSTKQHQPLVAKQAAETLYPSF